jgi:hypothetical protein
VGAVTGLASRHFSIVLGGPVSVVAGMPEGAEESLTQSKRGTQSMNVFSRRSDETPKDHFNRLDNLAPEGMSEFQRRDWGDALKAARGPGWEEWRQEKQMEKLKQPKNGT